MTDYVLDLGFTNTEGDVWNLSAGTSYRDCFDASYYEVEAVFGKPNSRGDKTNYEWLIRLPNNRVVTVYDYKDDSDKDRRRRWHIGAKHGADAEIVKAFFEYLREN